LKYIEYANVIVKYGRHDMLDRPELLASALLQDNRIRKTKRNSYHFLDVRMAQLNRDDPNSICIFGTFVKNTTLRREQVLREGKLVDDEATMESAPSAFFCLFLVYHRLAYVPQSSFAPILSEFNSTLRYFLRSAWEADLRSKHEEANDTGESRVTFLQLEEEYPRPEVKVVHATARDSIAGFLEKFSKIQEVKIVLIDRNQEFDRQSVLPELYEMIEPLKPKTATVNARNTSEGLDKENVKEVVTTATRSGYEEANISGIGNDGERLKGDNSEFRLKEPFRLIAAAGQAAASHVYASFQRLLKDGSINTNFTPRQISRNKRSASKLLDEYDSSYEDE
jgi:hypothetical protein